MSKSIKVLEFKTVSPLFEMERDGVKPFTTRLWNGSDQRFEFFIMQLRQDVYIKIVNPATDESFCRKYLGYSQVCDKWINIWLGEKQDACSTCDHDQLCEWCHKEVKKENE